MLRPFTLARKSASKEAGAVTRKGFDRISFLTTIQHIVEQSITIPDGYKVRTLPGDIKRLI
jgi:hypothetical protein